MCITRFISRLDIFILSLCMADSRQHAFRSDILAELHGSGQFRRSVPTLDTIRLFQQRDIFFRVRILDIFRNLTTSHLHIEIMAFQM